MIDRLKAWLRDEERQATGDPEDVQLAVAALLMEAAQIDGHLDEPEREAVRSLLERRFGLDAAAARQLAAVGGRQAEQAIQLFGFTRLINERLSQARRIELIEMLWEVAYADGVLDQLEDTMLRQVAGLVDVSDHERGEARRRVLRGLGIAEAG